MKNKKASAGLKRASNIINTAGEILDTRSGGHFGGAAIEKEGRLTAFGWGSGGKNVYFKGKNKDAKKNLMKATTKSWEQG